MEWHRITFSNTAVSYHLTHHQYELIYHVRQRTQCVDKSLITKHLSRKSRSFGTLAVSHYLNTLYSFLSITMQINFVRNFTNIPKSIFSLTLTLSLYYPRKKRWSIPNFHYHIRNRSLHKAILSQINPLYSTTMCDSIYTEDPQPVYSFKGLLKKLYVRFFGVLVCDGHVIW